MFSLLYINKYINIYILFLFIDFPLIKLKIILFESGVMLFGTNLHQVFRENLASKLKNTYPGTKPSEVTAI